MKFVIRNLQILQLGICEFRENRQGEDRTFLTDLRNAFPYFLHFLFDLDNIWFRQCSKNLLIHCRFHVYRCSESRTSFRRTYTISIHTFKMYSPIWVKFGLKYPKLVKMLGPYEFSEDREKQSRPFVLFVNKITFKLVP